MKVGVIGTGSMGTNHVRVYHEMGVLSAICDTDVDRVQELAKKYNCDWYTNVQSFLAQDLDAVSVVVPTPYHLEMASKCLEAGKHILVEKPLASELTSANKIVAQAFGAQRVLAVGYIERYNTVFRGLMGLVNAGEFGDITSVNIKRVGGIPRTARNVIMDLMTHDFNLLIEIFGEKPTRIHSHSQQSGEIVSSAQVLLEFNNASATCEANWLSPVKIRQIHITGTQAYAEVDLITQKIQLYKTTPVPRAGVPPLDLGAHITKETMSFKSIEPLKAELECFLAAVEDPEKNGHLIVNGQDALDTLSVTLSAVRGGWTNGFGRD